MIGHILALAISTIIISYFKPSARHLSLYNFVSDILAVVISLSLILIDCPTHSSLVTPVSCLSSCSCLPVSLTPVCDLSSLQTYTSACAAGCSVSSVSNVSVSPLYSSCLCAPSPSTVLTPGFCPVDCTTSLYYYMLVTFILTFLMTLGRVGNLLVHIRCVDSEDKALGMAIQEVFIALFAFIPGEIMFGTLVDSSCSLWSDTGSCASYTTAWLRGGLFGGQAVVSGLAAVFDGLVWKGVKELQLY